VGHTPFGALSTTASSGGSNDQTTHAKVCSSHHVNILMLEVGALPCMANSQTNLHGFFVNMNNHDLPHSYLVDKEDL
jgi:hypothetical protein